jgi:hypothetical protein
MAKGNQDPANENGPYGWVGKDISAILSVFTGNSLLWTIRKIKKVLIEVPASK